MADTLSKTIEGLQPGGNYIIQVRSKNGENDYSEWSQALNYSAPVVTASNNVQNTIPTNFNTPNGGQHFFQGAFGVPTQPALISIKNSNVPAVNPGSAGKYVLGVLDTFTESSGIVQPYQLTLQIPGMVSGASGGVGLFWKFVLAKNTASGNSNTFVAPNGQYGITAAVASAIATPGQVYFAVQNNANNSVSTVYNLFNTSGNTNQIAYLYDNSSYLLQSPAAISAASQTSSAPTGSTYFYLDTAAGSGWSGTTIPNVSPSIVYYPASAVSTTNLASQIVQVNNYNGGGIGSGATIIAIDWNPGTSPLNYYAYFSADQTGNPGNTLSIIAKTSVFTAPIVFAAWPLFTGSVYNSI